MSKTTAIDAYVLANYPHFSYKNLDNLQVNVVGYDSVTDTYNEMGISPNGNFSSNSYVWDSVNSLWVPKSYLAKDLGNDTLVTEDASHYRIHTGQSFTCSEVQDVANSGNFDILLVTGNTTERCHLTYDLSAESEFEFSLYEGITTSALGTSMPVFNRYRSNANVAEAVAYKTPTVTATGTRIRVVHEGAGKFTGGNDRGTHEWIPLPNTKYLFRMTNHTTSNNYMSMKIDWYEYAFNPM